MKLVNQDDDSIKNSKYDPEVLHTILGIKILQDRFKNDKLKWKFVVQKARKLLQNLMKKENLKEVDEILKEFKYEMKY